MIDLEKLIQQKVQKALEGSFQDATTYGTGYIKISVDGTDLEVTHVPLEQFENEIESFKQIKPFILPTSQN